MDQRPVFAGRAAAGRFRFDDIVDQIFGFFVSAVKDKVEGITKAIYQGEQWVKNHTSKEIAEAVQSFFPDTNLETLEAAIQSYKDIEAWNETPVLKEEAFNRLQEVITMAGELEKKAPYDKIVNNTYAEKVQNKK